MCSKNVYSIVHQNKKYRKIFNHSKKIDGGFDLYGTFAAKTDEFFFKKNLHLCLVFLMYLMITLDV